MLSITDKISFRERQILIHSYLYYHRDNNTISDKEYDRLSYGLAEMIKQYPNEFMESEYFIHFVDWTPATGFDLYDRLDDNEKYRVQNIADYLCRGRKYETNKK